MLRTTYYTRNETFNGAFELLPQAAEDLYGREVAHQVRLALQAVEMHLPGRCYAGPAGIAVGPTSRLITDESGRQDVFNLVLKTKPTADVTLDLTSSNPAEGTVWPSSVTFTPDDWNTIRTITVTGVANAVSDGEVSYQILIGQAVSDDPNYDGVKPADVLVANLNADMPAFQVSTTTALVSEAGPGDSFTVLLNVPPESEVAVAVTGGDQGEVTAVPAVLTFTPETWNAAQTVTLAGVDDWLLDGDQVTEVVLSVLLDQSDSRYGTAEPWTAWVTTTDDGYHGWQNRDNPLDVDGTAKVDPADVLTLINWINAHPTPGTLPAPPSEPPASYSDVDDDGRCSASDVLVVINWLNSQAGLVGGTF